MRYKWQTKSIYYVIFLAKSIDKEAENRKITKFLIFPYDFNYTEVEKMILSRFQNIQTITKIEKITDAKELS